MNPEVSVGVSPKGSTHWSAPFYALDYDGCWCAMCDDNLITEAIRSGAATPSVALFRRMNLCPDCGDKRCLRAAYHTLDCTAGERS